MSGSRQPRAMSLSEIRWRAQRFGFWTGTASLTPLRSECRYESMGKLCAVTRWIFTRLLPRQIYWFRQDRDNPLTFHCPDGTELRPWDQETDNGSVPRLLTPVIAPDQFPRSFWGHDHAYGTNGMFCRKPVANDLPPPKWLPPTANAVTLEWHFVEFTRSQSDWMLWAGVGAEGGLAAQRQAVYQAVNLAGWSVWRKRRGPPPKME